MARDALLVAHPGLTVDLVRVTTVGDRLPEVSLEGVEGRGFFTDSLERALDAGEADLAVHSLKDLPTELAGGFRIVAVMERDEPADVLVSPHGGLASLPPGARVGTDSARRRAQLALVRPDLRFAAVRGNVPTRLARLDSGDFDALVLAAAGLRRLGLGERAGEVLGPDVCLPAPGQGAIAVESRVEGDAAALAAAIDHPGTRAAVTAERAFLAGMGGGCRTPIGALATVSGGRLRLAGVVVEGGLARRVEVEGEVDEAAGLGAEAARRVLVGALP